MKLILARHGLAVEKEIFQRQNRDDARRPLVLKGRRRTLLMARKLRGSLEQLDMVVTSPYLRAKQTAFIFQREFGIKKAVEVMELIPSAPPTAFAQWLKTNAALSKNILAVGHEPQLSLFASWVLAGQGKSFIELKKAGILGLEVESLQDVRPAEGRLEFLVMAKMFE